MKIEKAKIWDYFILGARGLLAITFLSYGFGKLKSNQFGISEKQLDTQLKDLSLFDVSWYLFDQEPFKSFVGVFQIVTGFLILYNRTLIIGVLLSIPILLNILIIDITFVKMTGLYWRIAYYLFLDFLILWHYKERVLLALKSVTDKVSTKFKYPIWLYFVIPIIAILIELLGVLPNLLFSLITNPSETIQSLKEIPELISDVLNKIVQ